CDGLSSTCWAPVGVPTVPPATSRTPPTRWAVTPRAVHSSQRVGRSMSACEIPRTKASSVVHSPSSCSIVSARVKPMSFSFHLERARRARLCDGEPSEGQCGCGNNDARRGPKNVRAGKQDDTSARAGSVQQSERNDVRPAEPAAYREKNFPSPDKEDGRAQ